MKAVLIIDTPKSCNDCPLRVMESDLYYTYFTCQDDSCITEDSQEITRLEMNCPLKHLPKKREIKKDDEENMKHFKQGFNDAISIIEGTLIQTFDNDGEENE